ncbi:MAG: DUF255 domain-containing protein [Dehalococcoidia bacterium]
MSTFRFSPRPNRAHEIRWQEWGEAAFEQAQREDRPLLLGISAVWCHWCHVMDETSYSDQAVIDLINGSFIPVRVDNDQRPDINARYNAGGWPSTVLLSPEGEVLSAHTYLPPEQLRPLLEQVSTFFRENREEVRRRVEELAHRQQGAAAPAPGEVTPDMVESIVASISQAYDSIYGGLGTEPKFPNPTAWELVLERAHLGHDTRLRQMLTWTLDGMAKGGLFDHHEGGFFRYSTTRDWTVPHFEKMLGDNAALIRLYTHAYQSTGEDSYRLTAQKVAGYVQRTLYDPDQGAFYGSQDADEEYFALGLQGRSGRQPPFVDRTVYTDVAAAAASAFLELYQALGALGETEYRDVALKGLDFLWQRLYRPGEGMAHFPSTQPLPLLLADQVAMAGALLDAYQATGLRHYLDRARELASILMEHFSAPEGGFQDQADRSQALGRLRYPQRPLPENSAAARVLTRLAHLTGDSAYREAAHSTLRAFAQAYQQYGTLAADYALSVARFTESPVHVVIVGRPGDDATEGLLSAALSTFRPGKLVQVIDPGADGDRLRELGYLTQPVAAYVCRGQTCQAQVTNPEGVAGAVASA